VAEHTLRTEVRLSGSGGQGLMLAGRLLAEAAVRDGRNVVQTQSYGPEARGGKSKSDVVISEGEIDYPKATMVDVLLVMTPASYREYASSVKDGGVMIYDSSLVSGVDRAGAVAIPLTELAIHECGRRLFANVIALGAIAELTGVVGWDSIRKAVLDRVPSGTEEVNEKALAVGRAAAQDAKKGK